MATPVVLKVNKKRHSQRPYLRVRVQDSGGVAFDFTGAVGVTFVMYTKAEEPVEKVNAPANIVGDPTGGILEYPWTASDVDTAGEFLAEFDVNYGAGEIMTLPENGNILITIFADVNDA
jgi:hypothetical protein